MKLVHFVTDRKTGLRAVIAVHSTHLGPGAGGTRLWHYADEDLAITDALRLSRGMSYKNAMAGLPLGGGKAVILANDAARTKTPEMLAAFGKAVHNLARPLCHRRGCRDERRRHGRDLEGDALCRRPAGRGRRGRRRSGAAHQLRRLSRHQGGGEAGARQGQSRRPAHRAAGRGQRRRRRRAARGGGRARGSASPTSIRRKAQALAERDRRHGRRAGRDHDARGRRAQPQCAGRDPRRAVDRGAQRADRRGRREQPARDPRRRRPHPGAAASSTRPIM